jgi:hypothetical protein
MSMSQEEIEALMNESADLAPAVEEENTEVAEEEVAEEEIVEEESMSTDDIESLMNDSDLSSESEPETETDIKSEETDDVANINELLDGIDGIVDDAPNEEPSTSDMDDILAGIEGVTEDKPESLDMDAIMNDRIDQGVYPLPVEKEHQVVNQLNEVAEDSEEKATKIFDVLSFILDENAEIQKDTKAMGEFIEKQTALLSALAVKFPSVAVIGENLSLAQELSEASSTVSSKLDEENNQIFTAMDLMQFHDINRQKIERVMSVIKKLTTYLNGIFEDNSNKPEVQIAKHISGDGSDTVSNDDLDSLIAEFNN